MAIELNRIERIHYAKFNGYEELLNFMYFEMRYYILTYFDVERDGKVDEYKLRGYSIEECILTNKITLKYELLQGGKMLEGNKILEMTLEGGYRFKWYLDGVNLYDVFEIDDELDGDMSDRIFERIMKEKDLDNEI